MNSLLCVGDSVIMQKTEEQLQKGIFTLNNMLRDSVLNISAPKSQITAFKGKPPIKKKIIIKNQILNRSGNFNYLGCDISKLTLIGKIS